MGALFAGQYMDGFCALGNRGGRGKCHDSGAGEKSNGGFLCLYPDEYMQDAGFKICEKVLIML